MQGCLQFCSLFMSWKITVCKHNEFDHSGWYHWSMNGDCVIVQWASCWAQGRGACPHINSCTAISHLKEGNLITGMWKREYWNLIVQIRQSAPLFLWYNISPVMHHKTTLRHTNAHTFVFTDICSLEAMIYAHHLFGGKELEVLTDRLNDQCDIYKHIEWWFDNEFWTTVGQPWHIMTSLDTWMEHNMRKTG